MNPAELSAVEARRLIGARELSSVELVEACIAQIERIDPAVNAMVVRADDRARHEASEADAAARRGESLGALHGLPVAIKDIQDTAGIRTTYGSETLANNVPVTDSGIVARIRAAGGIVIGKTNVPEFSIGANTVNRLFGATGNPFDVTRTCGGSSGGSAVAIATNMAPLATGSDHGGSLRIPACYSGVVGYRATPGVVPNERRTIMQTNYSVQGPMARTVADAALLLSVIAQRSSTTRRDPMAFPLDAAAFATLDPMDLRDLRVAVTAGSRRRAGVRHDPAHVRRSSGAPLQARWALRLASDRSARCARCRLARTAGSVRCAIRARGSHVGRRLQSERSRDVCRCTCDADGGNRQGAPHADGAVSVFFRRVRRL